MQTNLPKQPPLANDFLSGTDSIFFVTSLWLRPVDSFHIYLVITFLGILGRCSREIEVLHLPLAITLTTRSFGK